MRGLLILLLASPASAVWKDAGGSTLQFLRLGSGARAVGMGEAYGPAASGAESMYWNPGALARAAHPDLAFSHGELLGLMRHDHLAFAAPARRLGGGWGLSATLVQQDSLPLVTNTDQTVGSFSPHGEALAVGYGRRFFVGDDRPTGDRGYFQDLWRHPGAYEPLDAEPEPWTGSLAAGAALKFVSETIYDESAWALALDAGLHFHPVDMPEMTWSAVLRNLGTRPRFRAESESLPLEGSAGCAYLFDLGDHRLLPALEVAVPGQGKPYAKLGLEYTVPVAEDWRLALRAGYKSLPAYDLGPLAGLAAGIGMQGRKFSADFAFTPMGALGEVFRFGVGWRFDDSNPRADFKPRPRAGTPRPSPRPAPRPRPGSPGRRESGTRY